MYQDSGLKITGDSEEMESKKITIPDIQEMKKSGVRIPVLTAYDYPTARILDEAGIPVLLVGDSAGMVMMGYENTLPVTVEDMILFTGSVARGRKRALLVADMPFLSYQVSIEEAKRNAGRLIKEGRAESVKLEGGVRTRDTIKAIVDMDIPVMAHIGLTPQSIHKFGGYRWQGRDEEARKRLLEDAAAVEEAGAFSVVLEGIPASLAQEITQTLSIPTIGIGAGPHCDGQVLVIHDILGFNPEFRPRFVKRYAGIHSIIRDAANRFKRDVEEGLFPDKEHYLP